MVWFLYCSGRRAIERPFLLLLSQCARTMGRLLMPPLLGEGRWALSAHATTQVTADFPSCGFPVELALGQKIPAHEHLCQPPVTAMLTLERANLDLRTY